LLLFIILGIFATYFIANKKFLDKSYSIFIEFNNAHGIRPGTILRLRGLSIGRIVSIKLQINTILVLAKINSSLHLISRNVLIETNQTGLLNEAVIDIFPLEDIKITSNQLIDPLSPKCLNSKIVCNLSYVTGNRGLNYDDLVRATTRISQRFDDPRFFNLFYIFLHNGIDLSDNIVYVSAQLLDLLHRLQKKI
jgi:phospholipid/cholesterol/gamma-HCH transport system substrate-binding protein